MNGSAAIRRMFDVPLDAWYVWLGLAVASGAALTTASALPAAPPPDAAGAAETVDSVAASPHAATGEHPLSNAESVRVGRDTVSLRGPGGTRHAELGYGPVTSVGGDERLVSVLAGTPPDHVFESPTAFERALADARDTEPRWRATDTLHVRSVSWEGVDAVLVG